MSMVGGVFRSAARLIVGDPLVAMAPDRAPARRRRLTKKPGNEI